MGEWRNKAIAIAGGGWIAYQIYIVFYSVDVIPSRIFHVCFALVIVYLMKPISYQWVIAKVVDVGLMVIPVIASIHVIIHYQRIRIRYHFVDPLTPFEVVIGTLLILSTVEATRRALGKGLTVFVIIFIAYAFLGPWMPGLLAHSQISFQIFVENNYLASTGMFGIPAGVSLLYVFYFIMFGGLLEMAGGGKFLMDVAMRATGRTLGGPAKTAVVASGFMGTISGSAVANVAGTGVMTIPLMKRVGFTPVFAGAAEAMASTGGQLMPPVMGAGAFVLAELTRIDYLVVCKAAAIPAIILYTSLLAVVHFKAGALGIQRLSDEDLKQYRSPLVPRLHLLIPIIVLVYSIASLASLMLAAFRAAAAALVVGFIRAETRPTIPQVIDVIPRIARGAAIVAIPSAAAGIIIGSVTLSGIGLKFTDLLLAVTGGTLVPTLLLTIIGCIILGMGMPTTAAYIMAAVFMAPAIITLGFPVLSAHLFIFYFAILSMVTPPVAVSAYTGAGIAGADMYKTGWEAFRMAIPGFLIPFIFIFNNALLLEHTSILVTIRVCVTTLIGVVALAAAMVGWLKIKLKPLERAVLFAAAFLMLFPEALTDLVGSVIYVIIYFWQWKKSGRQHVAAI
jgi:TRAP transporter 4TM/12TM fusion protein